ncbi:secreted arabinase [Exidia glandulosa HHB12029]|uniref:Arabinan endo-1,5-alpha-L-arabinosidase n=1 Tax=Exidia glandulosa HHB12029 TaxID=1314781 RepID=A0A165G1S1_EXIGL|nr:secreted arabinase [Exidia glandulosa HHB12029]
MHFISSLVSIVALLASTYSVGAVVGPGVVTGDTSVHDPSMCKVGSTYYLFSTAPGIEIRTSTDRTKWTLAGRVFPNGASWTDTYTGTSNGNLWAPDCYHDGSKFWLYYAASSFGSQKSAIFLATSTSGSPGSWTNNGLVISSAAGAAYNAIDPAITVDGSTHYLSWGSFWGGIYFSNHVNATSGLLTSTSSSNIAARPNNGGALEANTLFKNGNYWYLFTSWDKCCSGTSSTYNIRVGRSSSISGPFVDSSGKTLTSGGGTLVLQTHDGIYGPGGQDVYLDSDGPILVYHYYTSSGNWLGINRLNFTSGWPVVA